MRILMIVLGAATLATPVLASDYRDARYRAGTARYPIKMDTGIRAPPPLYYVEAPPRYVRDLRTGEPGQWVVRQPSVFEQLFGLPRDGY
ncbi:hypothetical protein AB7828_07915 [Tardiphaga sp. 215_C5_N2_1]|uniref:hypothetical protein n=1 Tax=Tardiphaga sp. 215_C5_N2_1 TaxID=3240774 RepID=UPI003F8B5F75